MPENILDHSIGHCLARRLVPWMSAGAILIVGVWCEQRTEAPPAILLPGSRATTCLSWANRGIRTTDMVTMQHLRSLSLFLLVILSALLIVHLIYDYITERDRLDGEAFEKAQSQAARSLSNPGNAVFRSDEQLETVWAVVIMPLSGIFDTRTNT